MVKIVKKSNILRFDDIENIEYRKGSQKFGGLLIKLMEFLRLYKEKEEKDLSFNIKDFEEKSNIQIDEIKELVNDEKGKTLYKFDININNENISFTNLTTDKNRFFESFDIDIRKNYEIYGVQDFYKQVGNDYINPHLEFIKRVMTEIHNHYKIPLNNVLDLGAGKGEITTILKNYGYKNIIGCDPYLYNEYFDNTNNKCLNFSFDDIHQGALDKYKFDTIICSYALHLAKPSIVPELLWKLSLISKNLIIITPNNKPFITEDYGWKLYNAFKTEKAKCRIYTSKNFK